MIEFLHKNKSNLAFLILTVILVFANFHFAFNGSWSLPLQMVSIAAILIWLIIHLKFNRSDWVNTSAKNSIHIGWLFVFIAILVRIYFLTIFPLDQQTGFEEIQTGSIALSILNSKELPLEFRFTNIIATLGFVSIGKLNLFALRFGFRIMGLVLLILLGLFFQSEKTNWAASLSVIFFAASSKFFVLSGSIADELFSGIPFLLLFLLCLNQVTKSKQSVFWSGAAGFFAGILLFEYLSYRIPIGVMLVWLVFFFQPQFKTQTRWQVLFSFFLCLIITAAPTLIQSINQPESSVLLDGFRRHFSERGTFFSASSIENMKETFLAVFGFPANISAFYTPIRVPMILPVFGWLFMLSCGYNLIFERNLFQKFLSITVFISLFSITLFSNNNNIGRTAPVLLILLLISANFLNFIGLYLSILFNRHILKGNHQPVEATFPADSEQRLTPKPNKLKQLVQQVSLNSGIKGVVFLGLGILLFLIVQQNLLDLKNMAKDSFVIQEYANDEFSLCSFFGESRQTDQKVHYFSSTGYTYCPNTYPETWYFSNQSFEITTLSMEEMESGQFSPGDLILIGDKNKTLEPQDINTLVQIGLESNSLGSFRTKTDITGKTIAASICYQCK